MKIIKCFLGILILGVGLTARAQDESNTLRAARTSATLPPQNEVASLQVQNQSEASALRTEVAGLEPKLESPERSTFFFGVLPIPVLTQSASVGFDYALDFSWALQTGYQQIAKENKENSLMGELSKVMNKNYFLGVRYTLPFHPTRGLYLATGYKKGSNEVSLRPPLFSRFEAKSVESYEGVYGTLGYQIPMNRKSEWKWVTDFSVAYAPGDVKSSEYSATVSEAGEVETQVTSTVGYGFFPSIQIGASF